MHKTAKEGYRVLIAAPFGRDAESVRDLLRRDGYDADACADLDAVARAVDDHVGIVVLTEEAVLGTSPALSEALAAQPPWSDVPLILLASRRNGRAAPNEALRTRLPESVTNVVVLERPLSGESLVSAVASAMRARQKQFEMRDRLVELRDGEAKFQAIADSIDQMVWSTLPDGYYDYYNQRWYDYTGVPAASTDGEAWNGMFHPDDRERAWARWHHSLDTGEPYEIEYRLRHRSGEYRWVLGRAQPLRDAGGAIVRWFGTCTEIHELVAAREVLARSREDLERMVQDRTAALEAEMANRERVEEALRQSQKMEAVGQLTGGLAHDFNNLLAGISGSLEMMQARIAQGRVADLHRYMDGAQGAAKRAAALTHRLLAFSRRQTLEPRPTDVVHLVADMQELIRRTVGPAIAIETAAEPGLWSTLVDPNQLENALLNLCINARDALPDGGSIMIEAANRTLDERSAAQRDMPPGDYVLLSVSDDGVGMPPEIVERVFEPFFTTKPIGVGTGLGLSMIFGFARQSGGQVRVDSQVGRGTTVTILLPRHDSVEAEAKAVEADERRMLPQVGKTVLVIDDEPLVRMLIVDVLEELGCTAIEAGDGPQGMTIVRSDAAIDLLITDVGLPNGMNGRQVADAAREVRPELKVLFVTGYAENAVLNHGHLDPGMQVVTKPFTVETMTARIRELVSK